MEDRNVRRCISLIPFLALLDEMNTAKRVEDLVVVVRPEHVECRTQGAGEDDLQREGRSTEKKREEKVSFVEKRRKVETGRTGSCGTMVNLERRSKSPTVAMSTPSTRICPDVASTNRKNELASVDLPHPVAPTIPTFSPALIEKDRS